MKYLSCKKIIFVFFLILFFYCSKSKEINIHQLSGYWKIDYIIQKNEKFIPKGDAALFDHYQLNFPKGVLNKVAYNIKNEFFTSNDAIHFKIEKLNKNYYINFKSKWDIWSTKVVLLDSQNLVLESGNREYYYKRPF